MSLVSILQISKALTHQYVEMINYFSPCSPRDSQKFSNTTVQKDQFFDAQLSSEYNSHIHTWLLEKP